MQGGQLTDENTAGQIIGADFGQALFDLRKQFNTVVEPHRSALWQYCLYLTGSAWEAEDLVQETMLKAFGRLSTIFQPVAVKPYLFRIASNTWIDALRRAGPTAAELDDDVSADETPADPDPIATRAAIERIVAVLPPRQRVACLLADVFDVSLAEIAHLLGVSTGAAKSLLHRARATLQSAAASGTTGAVAAVIEPPEDALIRAYLDAFNRRDLDALVALLQPDAISDILGVFVEHGREAIKRGSLAAWAKDEHQQAVRYGVLEGRPAFFVFLKSPAGDDALGWLIALDTIDGKVAGIRDYYYCSDFVRYTAAALGVSAQPNPPF